MANDSSKNVVVAEQLEALAVAAKNYTQNEIAKGDISAANFTLDTVPSTVEGAMWLDNSSDEKLVIYHNNQHYYFPLAVLPKILSVNVAPSSVAVMQGQSATATVSAVGNDAVTGLSYGLSGAPTWITISDDLILIQPSDNDLGIANVQVYAQDTGSDAMSAAILRAEAKLRPIIQSLSVVPPAVTVQQGQSAVATVSAVANEAVTDLSYSINGASSWISISDNSIIVAPTDNDLGSNTVDVIAYDTNSSASAATQFVATAALRPIISSVSVNPPTVVAAQGVSTTATISAVANAAVTGLSYSLEGQPSWMNLSGSVILMTPTENDSGSAAVTVTAYDIGSTAHAETVFNAKAKGEPKILSLSITPATLVGVAGTTLPAATINAVTENIDSLCYEWLTTDSFTNYRIENNVIYSMYESTGNQSRTMKLRAYDPDSNAETIINIPCKGIVPTAVGRIACNNTDYTSKGELKSYMTLFDTDNYLIDPLIYDFINWEYDIAPPDWGTGNGRALTFNYLTAGLHEIPVTLSSPYGVLTTPYEGVLSFTTSRRYSSSWQMTITPEQFDYYGKSKGAYDAVITVKGDPDIDGDITISGAVGAPNTITATGNANSATVTVNVSLASAVTTQSGSQQSLLFSQQDEYTQNSRGFKFINSPGSNSAQQITIPAAT